MQSFARYYFAPKDSHTYCPPWLLGSALLKTCVYICLLCQFLIMCLCITADSQLPCRRVLSICILPSSASHPPAHLVVPQRNEAAAKEGGPLEYFWRRQYVPEKGMYCDPPLDLQLGTRLPEADGKPKKGIKALEGGKGFVKDGVEYR